MPNLKTAKANANLSLELDIEAAYIFAKRANRSAEDEGCQNVGPSPETVDSLEKLIESCQRIKEGLVIIRALKLVSE